MRLPIIREGIVHINLAERKGGAHDCRGDSKRERKGGLGEQRMEGREVRMRSPQCDKEPYLDVYPWIS
jgi:hypothetical protein